MHKDSASPNPNSGTPQEAWFYAVVAVLGAGYFVFIGAVIWEDIKLGWSKVRAFVQDGAGGRGGGGGDANDQRRQSYSGGRQSYSVLS